MGFALNVVKRGIFLILLLCAPFTEYTQADDFSFMQEKVGEAVYRQMKLDQYVQQLEDIVIPKEYKLTIGNVSFVVTVFLQKRIDYKTTFP